jgi:hypothetical protein
MGDGGWKEWILGRAQEILPGMAEFSMCYFGREPEGTATVKPLTSHPEAKAECRMQNAEKAGKPPQSQLRATCMRQACDKHAISMR